MNNKKSPYGPLRKKPVVQVYKSGAMTIKSPSQSPTKSKNVKYKSSINEVNPQEVLRVDNENTPGADVSNRPASRGS